MKTVNKLSKAFKPTIHLINKMLVLMICISLVITPIEFNNNITCKNNNKCYIIGVKENKVIDTIQLSIESYKNKLLTENNLLVSTLSEKEKKTINKNTNISFIEEDFSVTANELDLDSDETIADQFYEAKVQLANKTNNNNKNIDKEWNMHAINANDECSNVTSSEKIKVAILDSGVDIIDGINLTETINLVPNEKEISPMFLDLTGHGTAIASIIAGNGEGGIYGINPNVELYSVKVLDENNSAPISRIIEGIYWCIENDINIINMSFGTSKYSYALEQAVKAAYNANILMIGATGNTSSSIEYPAAFEEVMAVAATNTCSEISNFSNVGDQLDIAAPGEKIKVSSFFGGNTINHGTSIAVPHVVGVASILWEKDKTKSNEFIRQLIKQSAKTIESSEYCGLLDMQFALEIYDEFNANYNNNTNTIQNDIIPENNESSESFEYINYDDNYVEGRWKGDDHKNTVTQAAKSWNFTSDEIEIMKKGAVYPDRTESGIRLASPNPEWHGFYRASNTVPVNYIACYYFVQKIAQKSGDVSSFTSHTMIPGLGSVAFNWIKNCFSSTGFGGVYGNKVNYSTILSDWSYKDKDNATKAKYRKLFIYGLSMHIIGDVFAHSTFDENLELLKHDGVIIDPADDTKKIPTRYECAKAGVKEAVLSARYNLAYSWMDFALAAIPEVESGEHNFRVANILKFAKNTGLTSNDGLYNNILFLNVTVSPTP